MMKFSTIKSIVFLLVFSTMTVTLFQNCGVEKPMVENMSSMSVGFSHSPIPASCISCHSDSKPAGSVNVVSASTQLTSLYYHSAPYGGDNDCASCHTQNQQDVGISWKSGVFNHKNNLGASVTTCNECHTTSRPATHTSASGQLGECLTCHANTGANWSTSAFSHTPVPTSCNSCHNTDRPASTQYFAANPAKPTLNLYVHASQYNGSADCVSCHISNTANVGVSWSGGTYNHKTNTGAVVNNCLNCHTGSRPTSHTTASGQMGECFSCHTNAGVDWASSGGAVPLKVTYLPPTGSGLGSVITDHPSTASRVGMSCTSCHTNYNATFSIKAIDHNQLPSGTQCLSCHTTNQQVVTSGVSFKTVSSTHEGKKSNQDCISCHSPTYPTWNSTTKIFSGGKWDEP